RLAPRGAVVAFRSGGAARGGRRFRRRDCGGAPRSHLPRVRAGRCQSIAASSWHGTWTDNRQKARGATWWTYLGRECPWRRKPLLLHNPVPARLTVLGTFSSSRTTSWLAGRFVCSSSRRG